MGKWMEKWRFRYDVQVGLGCREVFCGGLWVTVLPDPIKN